MHLWVLCLKLWWLALPLSTLQHPSSFERRGTAEQLTPGDAELASGLNHAHTENELDSRALLLTPSSTPSLAPFFLYPDSRPFRGNIRTLPRNAIFNPAIFNYTGPGRLFNYSSNNPDPIPDEQRREPDPDWPPVDPYPPSDPDTWSFDFAFPPYGPKLVEIKGEINLKSSDINVFVIVMGYPLGDFRGNLDDGIRIDINLTVVKGYLEIFKIQGKPKDQIWLKLDLKTLFRHWQRTVHMFDIPHQDPIPPKPKPADRETA
ncbi:MAG: hypothetical protein Q9223_002427 [Gallowayella weberi]